VIERHVYVRLKSEYATPDARAELLARTRLLRDVPFVRELSIEFPADADARRAWDLCLRLRFDSLGDVERYLDDPRHAAYYEGFLLSRLQVIKAWNFEVEPWQDG
jgi:hypothetical protein